MISRISKVKGGVMNRSRRLGLITLAKALIIWISQKLILIIVLLHGKRKKRKLYFCLFIDGKQHQARELDVIILRNHACGHT